MVDRIATNDCASCGRTFHGPSRETIGPCCIAIVSEGTGNAVVPLPGGRNIPVQLSGGAAGTTIGECAYCERQGSLAEACEGCGARVWSDPHRMRRPRPKPEYMSDRKRPPAPPAGDDPGSLAR